MSDDNQIKNPDELGEKISEKEIALFRKIYLFSFIIFCLLGASLIVVLSIYRGQKINSPCESLPHSTSRERQYRALCEIGEKRLN